MLKIDFEELKNDINLLASYDFDTESLNPYPRYAFVSSDDGYCKGCHLHLIINSLSVCIGNFHIRHVDQFNTYIHIEERRLGSINKYDYFGELHFDTKSGLLAYLRGIISD